MDGKEIVLHRPIEARHHGIEIVHQDLALCNNLTAAANVFLGRELRRGIGPLRDPRLCRRCTGAPGRSSPNSNRRRGRAISVKQMSGGQRQAVAIARTMLSQAKIVLMDEPTAAISVRQVAEVLNLIRHLRDQGIAVVLISHRMPDVFDGRRPGHRHAPRPQGRRQARSPASSPEEVTGLITGAIEQV